jgi:signal transduction histidine kinase
VQRPDGWAATIAHLRIPLAIVAALVAMPAVVAPAWRFHRPPSVFDAATSLVLLGCGLLARGDRRRDVVGLLLIGASLAWSLPALVPSGYGSVDRVLAELGLGHITLLVLALLVGAGWPTESRSSRLRRLRDVTAILGLATGVSGALGGYRVLLPLTGVCLIAAMWRSPKTLRVAGVLLGGELVGVAILRPAVPGIDEAQILILHEFTVMAVGVLLAYESSRLETDRWVDDADPLGRLLGSLAQVLMVPSLDVAFPAANGRFVDAEGDVREPPVEGAVAISGGAPADPLLAVVAPAPRRIPAQAREALRLLRDQARLRHQLAASLDELEASQRRLLRAGDAEREALGHQLRTGAIAHVEALVSALSGDSRMSDVLGLAREAQAGLEAVVSGLDPLNRGLSLTEALHELEAVRGIAVTVEVCAEPESQSAGRTVWFVCAEAVNNAMKHAPGAAVRISVEPSGGGIMATVVDDGPGGADRAGSGLAGLADRAGALGGALRVDSPPGQGTILTLFLPGPTRMAQPSSLAVAQPLLEVAG